MRQPEPTSLPRFPLEPLLGESQIPPRLGVLRLQAQSVGERRARGFELLLTGERHAEQVVSVGIAGIDGDHRARFLLAPGVIAGED